MTDGGYDADFVEEVSDQLTCVICSFALKDPVHLVECGHRLCAACYQGMKDYATKT